MEAPSSESVSPFPAFNPAEQPAAAPPADAALPELLPFPPRDEFSEMPEDLLLPPLALPPPPPPPPPGASTPLLLPPEPTPEEAEAR